MSLPIGGGLGGILLLLAFLWLSGSFGGGSGGLGGLGGLAGGNQGPADFTSLDPNDDQAQFVNAVTVDVQDFWASQFQAAGKGYTETVLVLFTDQTQTGCGVASSATGPFYC